MFEVEFTDEFEEWWNNLDEDAQESCFRTMRLLQQHGPALGRPNADTLKGSRFPSLKVLRIQHQGDAYRISYAFDPRRVALLLLGGVKRSGSFYREHMWRAENIYEKVLLELESEGLIETQR